MPETSLWQLRSLVLRLRDDAPVGWGAAELVPWVEQRPELVGELHGLGGPGAHRRRVGDEVRWGLYALSRLVDIVIGPYQPAGDGPGLVAWTTGEPWWSGPAASASAWPALCSVLGATVVAEDRFHPFFHEVVAVEPAADPDEPPSLVAEHWPGALIGGLLPVRAGVTVRAGRNVLDPVVAARSCLYWAWWRRNRPVRDLSHGWGQNSQWRTDFRRDYVDGEELHYNVDGTSTGLLDPEADDDLPERDRRDLLRFRHSLCRDLGEDRWPYGYRLVERRRR